MEIEYIESLFGFLVVYGIAMLIGLGTLMDLLDGFCYGLTGKLPFAHLRNYKIERRRKRAIAREERRKARENKKKRT